MELSPSWQAASCAATHELLSILWNPEVHYRVYKIPPLVSTTSQSSPVNTTPSYLSKINFNIVTCMSVTIDGVLDLIQNVLTTYTHSSELQIIIVL
jgi:hypothetical protein